MKTCRKCKKQKNTAAFKKKRSGIRDSVCRECTNKKTPPLCSRCAKPPITRSTPDGLVGGLTRFRDEHLCLSCLNPDPDAEDVERTTREILRDTGGNLLY